MKKIILSVAMIFSGAVVAQAQETIVDPNSLPTVTSEQIRASAKNHLQTQRDIIVLDFEGLGDLDYINDFYNGSKSEQGYSGTNHGVVFGDAMSVLDSDAGGSGNIANEPSPNTVMFFLNVGSAYMNVAAGFTTGFSTYYATSEAASVEVYDGLNGTGKLLGSAKLPVNVTGTGACQGDPTGYYCQWDTVNVPFAGIAKSIKFIGSADYVGFDDVTFGSNIAGGLVPLTAIDYLLLLDGDKK